MTLEILLAPDQEARLRDRAAAEGKDVLTFVREAIDASLAAPALTAGAETAPAQRLAALEQFIALGRRHSSHLPQRYIADDSRESIYGEREDLIS